jgi:tetratricopeptide (TPR) repeat protein
VPAQPAPQAAEPTLEQREKAREAYTRGQSLFAESKFSEAEAAFIEAYAAVPNPVVLLSTAECQVRLGKLDDAYAALKRYLSERPDAPDRAEIERKAAELLALPAMLVLSSEPAGAAIKLDGQDTGRKTPAEISVSRGPHKLDLALSGYDAASESVEARIGARHELHAVLKATAKAPAAGETAAADLKVAPEAPHGTPATALWITSIVGAAGLVTGTVLGFMVLAERSDYDANPTEATAKRGERLALFTDVAFGMGAMALVTGAVLYFTGDSAQAPSSAEPAASVQLAPSAFAHGAGVAAHGRF